MQEKKTKTRLLVVLIALLLPAIASVIYFVWLPGTPLAKGIYSFTKVFMLVWPVIAIRLCLRERFRDTDPDRPMKQHFASIQGGILFGLITITVMYALYDLTVLGVILRDNADNIFSHLESFGVVRYFWLLAIFISFFNAAFEEFYWRWFGFGQLRKICSPRLAHLFAAIGFSLHHIVVLSQFVPLSTAVFLGACVGIGGAVWSLIYHGSRSLWGAWVSHLIIDLGIMWIGWQVLQYAQLGEAYGSEPLSDTAYMIAFYLQIGFLVVGFVATAFLFKRKWMCTIAGISVFSLFIYLNLPAGGNISIDLLILPPIWCALLLFIAIQTFRHRHNLLGLQA